MTDATTEGRSLWALANISIALILGAVVAATLNGPVRDVRIIDLAGATSADGVAVIPLPVSTASEGMITRSAMLRVHKPLPAGVAQISIRVHTYDSTPRLAGATLSIGETCAFEAAAETLSADASVVFRRTKPCDAIPAGGTAATLSIRFGESRVQDARCALLGSPVQGDADVLSIEFNGRQHALFGEQTILRSDTTMTRASLLAYMWGRPTAFVWQAFGAAAMLILAAGALLACRRIILTTTALAALAAGLALVYALLVPPLHAPDEPNHLLGYANAFENEALAVQTEAWARAVHFERITSDPEQRFLPSSIGQPWTSAWRGHVTPVDEVSRSPLNVRYWRLLARWLDDAGPAATLLGVRMTNALVFGGVVGLACLLVSVSDARQTGYVIPLALLLVPTLPFFAMHMSNYALLTSGYVLLAVGVGAICHGKTDAPGVGLLLGFGISISLATSLGSLPMLAIVATALLAAVVARADGTQAPPRYLFWGMFVVGAVAISVAPGGTDPVTKAGIYRGLVYRLLSEWRWIAIAIGIAGVGIDRLLTAMKRRPASPRGAVLTARGLQGIAVAFAVVALVSLVYRYPVLQPMETREGWPTPGGYALEVLRSAVTLGRLSYPDWFLSSTFWAGFGWLETYPGDWMTNLLTGATVAALVGLLLTTARARDNSKTFRLLLVACGAAVALAIYGMGAAVQRTNLHGRYLVGLYLCGLAICWSVTAVAAGSDSRRMQAVTTLVFSIIAGVHGASLVFILRRYF